MSTSATRRLAAALLAASTLIPTGFASAQEYLATRSRQNFMVAPEQRPHVSVPKRPDFFVQSAVLSCDTREADQRLRELDTSMAAVLAAAANDPAIEISVLRQTGEDAFAIPLTDIEQFRGFITGGDRPDSSVVRFLLKTPVGQQDDLGGVEGRLERFRQTTPMTGRSELLFEGEPELSLVDPRRHRLEVVRAIAEDARAIAEAMGEGYAVTVTGLERELGWRRSSDLELRLFIQHAITIAPRP